MYGQFLTALPHRRPDSNCLTRVTGGIPDERVNASGRGVLEVWLFVGIQDEHQNSTKDATGGRMASQANVVPGVGAGSDSIPKVILASAVGTMIEWYDFYIFGSLAAVLSPKFYPAGNDTIALIAYLSTFAVGFLVRPFGALFFGRIGDIVGRK